MLGDEWNLCRIQFEISEANGSESHGSLRCLSHGSLYISNRIRQRFHSSPRIFSYTSHHYIPWGVWKVVVRKIFGKSCLPSIYTQWQWAPVPAPAFYRVVQLSTVTQQYSPLSHQLPVLQKVTTWSEEKQLVLYRFTLTKHLCNVMCDVDCVKQQ